MFGKVIKYHGSALIEVEIIASELPATMPTTSDGIENLGDGYTLAPGSTMIVTGTDKEYMLGTDGTWEEYSAGGGGGGGGGSAYHHAGTKTVAELTSSLLVADNEGNVYNITDSGTTTSDFIEGAGNPISAGDNVGVAKVGEDTYKFDLLSGFVDISVEEISATATGTSISVNSAYAKVQGLVIKGHSAASGNAIHSIGDNGLTVTISDGTASNTLSITSGLPLRKTGDYTDYPDYHDEIDFESGTITKRCGEIDLGNLSWWISSDGYWGASLPFDLPITGRNPGVCSKYTFWEATTGTFKDEAPDKSFILPKYSNNDKLIYIKDSDYPTSSTSATIFKNSLSGVKLVYPLTTATTSSLSAAEIAAFKQLKTYEGATTITATDDPFIEADYLRNTDNGKAVAAVQNDAQTQINGKADKVASATSGNFASLDSNGNLEDSGNKAADFAAASHTQASSTINAMTGYEKPSSASAISPSDTLNQAMGKLEKALDSAGGITVDLLLNESCSYNTAKTISSANGDKYKIFVVILGEASNTAKSYSFVIPKASMPTGTTLQYYPTAMSTSSSLIQLGVQNYNGYKFHLGVTPASSASINMKIYGIK